MSGSVETFQRRTQAAMEEIRIDADPDQVAGADHTCCSPDEQASCCQPAEKAGCCGSSTTGGCACR